MNAKDKILQAAYQEFALKGKGGARVDEIARRAGVNKAMIYYHFKSKNDLYRAVLRSIFNYIFPRVLEIVQQDRSLKKTLADLIDMYFETYTHRPELMKILLRELADEGQEIISLLKEMKEESPLLNTQPQLQCFNRWIKEGKTYPLDPRHTWISFIGMTLIYFIGRPLFLSLLKFDEEEKQILQGRKENIINLLMHGLAANKHV